MPQRHVFLQRDSIWVMSRKLVEVFRPAREWSGLTRGADRLWNTFRRGARPPDRYSLGMWRVLLIMRVPERMKRNDRGCKSAGPTVHTPP